MVKINKSLCVAIATLISGAFSSVSLSEASLLTTRSGEVTKIQPKEKRSVNRLISGMPIFSEDFQTQADPDNPVLPDGWVVFDVDGQIPNGNVAFFTEAWIALEDSGDEGDFTAASTSWYNPPGTSDDWLITPSISLLENSILSWVARARDQNFRDGYEVYLSTTTQDVDGCSANPAIFSIIEEETTETLRTVYLSSAGFADEDVFVCFRNNSENKFVLLIDDVNVVNNSALNDVLLDAVALPEYSQVPDKLMSYDIPLSVDFTNAGANDQSNILVEAEIFLDMVSLTTVSQTYSGPLAALSSDSIGLGAFNATAVGVYDVVYTLTLDGVVDEAPDDNTVTVLAATEITTDTMARDEGEPTGVFGLGANNDGYLGNQYDFNTEVTVSGIQFIHYDSGALDGEAVRVDVFKIDNETGLPGQMVGSSEDYIVPVGAADNVVVDLIFPGNLNLSPGGYVFAVLEPEIGGLAVHTTTNRFTAGTAWLVFPLDPIGAWSNNEDLGFSTTYFMRPKFIETDLIFKDGF